MNKSELLGIIASTGISPSKKLGQNFLVDANFLDWLLRAVNPQPGQRILEVGPGFGVMTSRMLDAGADLTAIEFDRKIAEWIKSNLVPKGLKLIEGDACRVDMASVFGPGVPFRFISNLPYSCGSVILAKLFVLETPPSDMVVMLQKEVAQRLTAPAGSEAYGSLSVRAQAAYAVEIIKKIPPQVFHPQPEIDSNVIRLTLRKSYPSWLERKTLSQLVRVGFSQRRKKMFKQLVAVFGEEPVRKAYAGASVELDVRAERVSIKQFMRMASIMAEAGANAEIPEPADPDAD